MRDEHDVRLGRKDFNHFNRGATPRTKPKYDRVSERVGQAFGLRFREFRLSVIARRTVMELAASAAERAEGPAASGGGLQTFDRRLAADFMFRPSVPTPILASCQGIASQ